jgi:hypothetical protein
MWVIGGVKKGVHHGRKSEKEFRAIISPTIVFPFFNRTKKGH